MINAPEIPRPEWASHPNYPEQTLLLRSHENFRLLADHVLEIASTEPERAVRLFRRWMHAMRNHERYEEGKLYPFLARRFGASFGALTQGHEELGRLRDAVFAALPHEVVQHLQAFRAALLSHLDEEEETVIPMLLALAPDEFADFVLLPVSTLLARLDSAGQVSS